MNICENYCLCECVKTDAINFIGQGNKDTVGVNKFGAWGPFSVCLIQLTRTVSSSLDTLGLTESGPGSVSQCHVMDWRDNFIIFRGKHITPVKLR